MKKQFTRGLAVLALGTVLATGSSSCTKDLDRDPPLNELATDDVYRDFSNYRSVMAKLYGALVLTGQQATEAADIIAPDEGATSYYRLLWKLQELTTDEAVVAWADGAIQDLNTSIWLSTNNLVDFMYVRIFYQVGLSNEFLRQTTDSKLSERGISGTNAEQARTYRAEARFLRALAYYHAVDMYGSVPFVTENDEVRYFLPRQISRADLFTYVESELKAIEDQLPDRAATEYGRASKGAARTLLAKLYLNAEVYTGTARYTDCLTYCNKVMGDGYALTPNYRNLFRADNNLTSASEIIFPILCDGNKTRSYGGTTFLVHAAVSGSPRTGQIIGADQGVNGGWGGIRSKNRLPLLFADSATLASGLFPDRRANFSTVRATMATRSVTDITTFDRGFPVRKWTNKKSNGTAGSDSGGEFADTDIPLFRLGDVYLMYAEAVLRGGTGGDQGTALRYVNDLRQRAHNDEAGTMQNYPGDLGAIDLNFIIDERGRELHWEAQRRTDLVRFGRFTGSTYSWPFKGSNRASGRQGVDVPAFRNLFPIPATDLAANPNLVQNPGY